MPPAPTTTGMTYRGRFAPSPTGPLHFGSLVAAVASYLQARARNGRWLVRIDDLDPPRVVPGAADGMLRDLERLGLGWDEDIMYQSRRGDAYRAALGTLSDRGLTFGCACSRKSAGPGPYPGTCRDGIPGGKQARSVRVRTRDEPTRVTDAVQGEQRRNLQLEVGDFVVWRADGHCAYHLAVVVDDAAQGITEVVRGSDLLESTHRQVYLQALLGMATPRYAHVPVAVNEAGQKLSKQTGASPVSGEAPGPLLHRVLRFLGQAPPRELAASQPGEILSWAVREWRMDRVPAIHALPLVGD